MQSSSKILVTGANGHLGRRLLRTIDGRAAVRSSRAASVFEPDTDVRIIDYGDADAIEDACQGCDRIVHLVGIIKEGGNTTYEDAHERATVSLLEAARRARIKRIVYLSIAQADQFPQNGCLASKARAERLLLESTIPTVVIRVPMVLGEGDYASAALLRQASSRVAFTFRAASLEQPIYAGDVIEAIRAALGDAVPPGVIELAGPRSLPRRELIHLASDGTTRVVSLPLALGMALARMCERLLKNPPVTRDMLEVIDHDNCLDASDACQRLGIELTSLESTLANIRTVGGAALDG